MKKILILCVLLLLSSCSIDWNWEKDKKIAELEKQIKNDTFKKKQECAKYKDDIMKNIQNWISWIWVEKLDEIFYSQSMQSCLYVIHRFYNNSSLEDYDIFDVLSQKLIFNTNKKQDFNTKLKELKWE